MMAWGVVLLLIQMITRFHFWGYPIAFNFMFLLIVYQGFSGSSIWGTLLTISLGILSESFSQVPHGSVAVSYLILFFLLKNLHSRIYSEAYVTKSLWVMLLSLINSCLVHPQFNSFFWIQILLQAVFDFVLSLPLFILLDYGQERWIHFLTRRRSELTGADLYQAKSPQRRYI